jgi:hypothetical protein
MRTAVHIALFSIAAATSGCGSGLKYTIDDRLLAQLPPGDLAPVAAARQEADAAAQEITKSKTDLDTAKREYEAASVEADKAELAYRTASAKAAWKKAVRNADESNARVAERNDVFQRSRVENEKAKIAAQKNISVSKDFNSARFEGQKADLQKAYAEAKLDAAKEKAAAEEAERKFNELSNKMGGSPNPK